MTSTAVAWQCLHCDALLADQDDLPSAAAHADVTGHRAYRFVTVTRSREGEVIASRDTPPVQWATIGRVGEL